MYNDNQPRDEQGRWTSGGFGYSREDLATEFDRTRGASSGKPAKHIELPKQEYATLCSAVRTKYADKIPKKGQMLYGDNYYRFKYNKSQERIVCTFRLEIAGNESLITNYMEIK